MPILICCCAPLLHSLQKYKNTQRCILLMAYYWRPLLIGTLPFYTIMKFGVAFSCLFGHGALLSS